MTTAPGEALPRPAERELAFISRLYAVLSRVNEAIVRIRDEGDLFREVCRIVSEQGGFPLVWVGLVQDRRVAVAASWGPASTYLGEMQVDVAGEMGQGPTGSCIREDRPVVNDDFSTNPATWPWRESTRRYGLRASAAFPVRRGGRAIGAVTFYAARPGFFTPKQVALLESLAADLSFALDAMDQERRRSAAEQELRQANEHLREADRHKDEFLSMLSHELRNPMAPILNAIRILDGADPGGPLALEARGILRRQTAHLARLVDDLLDVTRIARGKIELRRTRIDLRGLVARTAVDFRSLAPASGLEFRLDLPERPLWADADPTRIAQVVGNLLHNATKFTAPGGTVSLALAPAASGAEERPAMAEIRVRDTGTGIDPALLRTIFEPFVQGPRSLARSEGGLGLGLALVRGIAELHGGSADACSGGPGAGAEFIVRLPLTAPAGTGPDPAPPAPRGDPRRVLVVDDNKDAADSLRLLLKLLGHQAEVAYDGTAALAMARRDPPDLVLCDLGLPGMDGFELARRLRAALPACPRLVAVSGYAQREDVERSLAAGFDGHIAKPPDPAEIARQLACAAPGIQGAPSI